MKKIYSMSEKYIKYIKDKAESTQIAESDMLRRIIDRYMELEQDKKEQKKQNC